MTKRLSIISIVVAFLFEMAAAPPAVAMAPIVNLPRPPLQAIFAFVGDLKSLSAFAVTCKWADGRMKEAPRRSDWHPNKDGFQSLWLYANVWDESAPALVITDTANTRERARQIDWGSAASRYLGPVGLSFEAESNKDSTAVSILAQYVLAEPKLSQWVRSYSLEIEGEGELEKSVWVKTIRNKFNPLLNANVRHLVLKTSWELARPLLEVLSEGKNFSFLKGEAPLLNEDLRDIRCRTNCLDLSEIGGHVKNGFPRNLETSVQTLVLASEGATVTLKLKEEKHRAWDSEDWLFNPKRFLGLVETLGAMEKNESVVQMSLTVMDFGACLSGYERESVSTDSFVALVKTLKSNKTLTSLALHVHFKNITDDATALGLLQSFYDVVAAHKSIQKLNLYDGGADSPHHLTLLEALKIKRPDIEFTISSDSL